MAFNINSKELERLLSKVIHAVPSKTPIAILENILIDINEGNLTVYTTDLEIFLHSSINIQSDDKNKILVQAHLLFDIVKSLDDTQVKIEIEENNKLKLTTDKGVYNLSYTSPDDFPPLPEISEENEIKINGKLLKKAIDLTSFAMSKEDMRPAMTGTLLEFTDGGIRFVTTDGHRLVRYTNGDVNFDTNEQYILPERAVNVLSRLITDNDVNVLLSKTHLIFKIGDIEFITRLIGEKYPAYNSVIPLENDNELKVTKKDILSSIRRMGLFSITNTKQVKFSIKQKSLEVSAEDINSGSNAVEEISCEYDGEPMDIGFNTLYIQDILTHINNEELVFKLQSPTKACIIEPTTENEKEDLMLLLMPVRLNG